MKKESRQSTPFVVCLNNDRYKASLEMGRLYRVIPDQEASEHGLLRVVDESGEDYAFEADRFHTIVLPTTVEKALLAASQS
jgi:hypothetical protein